MRIRSMAVSLAIAAALSPLVASPALAEHGEAPVGKFISVTVPSPCGEGFLEDDCSGNWLR